MSGKVHELHGVRVFECDAEGPQPRNDRDAVDLMSEAGANGAKFVAIPVARLGADFFRLRTRIAGEVLQKFVTYRMPVAIVGDISDFLSESSTLRDFVHESNHGDQVWFVASLAELDERLGKRG